MRGRVHDVTAVVPLRVDSVERAQNVDAVLRFVRRNLGAVPVLVREQPHSGSPDVSLPPTVDHRSADAGPVFHKAPLLNGAILAAQTRLVLLQDADVLVADAELRGAIEAVSSGEVDLAVAHDGRVYELAGADRERALGVAQAPVLAAGDPVAVRARGGVVVARRDALLEAGLFCERFVGWGPEDVELVERVGRLGGVVRFGLSPAWHLAHPRGADGGPGHAHHAANVVELRRLRSLSVAELRREVGGWPWAPGPRTEVLHAR